MVSFHEEQKGPLPLWVHYIIIDWFYYSVGQSHCMPWQGSVLTNYNNRQKKHVKTSNSWDLASSWKMELNKYLAPFEGMPMYFFCLLIGTYSYIMGLGLLKGMEKSLHNPPKLFRFCRLFPFHKREEPIEWPGCYYGGVKGKEGSCT